MIVHHSDPVTLIGGGNLLKSELDRALAIGSYLVAADGGADSAVNHNKIPKVVIGDFDSISDTTVATVPKASQHLITEQKSTDFDKCLRNISAPLILGIGFCGGHIDHQLAAFNSLVRHSATCCVLLGADDVVFLAPPSFRIDLPEGTRVSLFPFGTVEGHSDGLKWPISGLTFTPDGKVGTSNEATGPVTLSVTAPKLLVVLPATHFETVAKVLLNTPSHWPSDRNS